MKSILYLTILAVAFTCILACDPDSENEPECTSKNVNVPIRNFWDPTQYWLCPTAGAKAERHHCPDGEGFHTTKFICVSFEEWTWTEYCPENINK
ncbi:uncharacterized protein ACRADG_006563 [Cochliomyia hominivorax]